SAHRAPWNAALNVLPSAQAERLDFLKRSPSSARPCRAACFLRIADARLAFFARAEGAIKDMRRLFRQHGRIAQQVYDVHVVAHHVPRCGALIVGDLQGARDDVLADHRENVLKAMAFGIFRSDEKMSHERPSSYPSRLMPSKAAVL